MKKGKRIGIIIIIIISFIGLGAFTYRTIQEEKELTRLRNFYSETLQSKIDAEKENEINKQKITVLTEKNKELEATIQEKDKTIANKDAQINKLNQEITNLKK